jgi:hypothetical protein
MADKQSADDKPTAAEKREQTAAEKEAARAEAQRVLALRLRVGPIRDAE